MFSVTVSDALRNATFVILFLLYIVVSKKYETLFKEAYSLEFPSISKSKKGSSYAFCSVCACDFSVSHGGKCDVVKHVQTKKHKDKSHSLEKSCPLNTYFKDDTESVTRAECLFTAFIVEHNLPLNFADHAGPLLRKMFPDSAIAKKYGCARTKTGALLNVLGDMEKGKIVGAIQSLPFSVATDGSNQSDSKLYPVVVTFPNVKTCRVESCLLCIPVLEGDSTGQNIGRLLLDTLTANEIPLANCMALGADNAPVMVGHKNGVAAVLKRDIEHLIVLGCPCHLINLAAEKGAACLPVKIEEYLIDIYYYLEKSCKRKEKFKKFQDLHSTESRKILKHLCTWWLSLGRCLNRVLQQWDPLTSLLRSEVSQTTSHLGTLETYTIPKLKQIQSDSNRLVSQPTTSKLCDKNQASKTSNKKRGSDSQSSCSVKQKRCKQDDGSLSREERLFMFLSSSLDKAFCLFVSNIVPVFEITNVLLQSSVPQIHILRSSLLHLLLTIMSRFVKPTVVTAANSCMKVDYHSESNQKNDSDVVIGNATSLVVDVLKKEDKVIFFKSVRKYFSTTCDYILHKFPLNSDVLIHAQVADLKTISTASFSSLKFFVSMFPFILNASSEEFDKEMDVLQSQFCTFQCLKLLPPEVEAEDRIDTKWFLIGQLKAGDGSYKYDKLVKVMLAILSLPHSNAECERIFSQVTKTKTQFRTSLSDTTLEKLLLMKSSQGLCFEQRFDSTVLKKAKSATTAAVKVASVDKN